MGQAGVVYRLRRRASGAAERGTLTLGVACAEPLWPREAVERAGAACGGKGGDGRVIGVLEAEKG